MSTLDQVFWSNHSAFGQANTILKVLNISYGASFRSKDKRLARRTSDDQQNTIERPSAGVQPAAMPIRSWFPTLIYSEPLQKSGLVRLNDDLAEECQRLRDYDDAGRKWSAKNYPGGYTSYASMSQLQHFSSGFGALEKKLTKHVLAFAKSLQMDLRGREVFMTDCWVNIMPETASHSLHLHPLSFISGTYYVRTPAGCPGLKFEDPRLSKFMAAPPKIPNATEAHRPHVTYPAQAGNVLLFESWLRHEVASNRVAEERISISFNYNWS